MAVDRISGRVLEGIFMERFAFVLHPLRPEDFSRKFSWTQYCSGQWVERAMKWLPPLKAGKICGVQSMHNQAEGWFVACPLTARQIMELPQEYVFHKIIKTGKLAEKLGAKILGLGAFTSIVGDAGVTIAKNLAIPVTTGNSYTVATALEGTYAAARKMGIDVERANILVLGATGSIGAACAQILAEKVRYLTLAARDERKLSALAERIYLEYGAAVKVTRKVQSALRQADIVIAVTSALDSIIEPADLKPGAVVCDVARPRNVSKAVCQRNDVLVIEGGVIEVPGDVDFGINFGFPAKTAYACMAETMILALEGRYENFTLGRDLSVKQIRVIRSLAQKHGFKLAGLRSFERALTEEDIRQIRENAKKSVIGAREVG